MAVVGLPEQSALSRLYRLARPFFVSSGVRWRARGLLFLLLLLLISIKGFDVLLSYIGRDFTNALEKKNAADFYYNLRLYLLAFLVAIPIAAFYRFTEERLALLWRRWMSQSFISRYLSNRVFYRLSWYRGIDNPDQRIEEDVRSFTVTSLSLFLIFLQSLIALIAFTSVLAKISVTLTLVAVGYAVCGSIGTYFLGRPLIGLNFEQLRRDADYRYKLIKVRDSAESIALYSGESIETTRVRQRLREAIRNMRAIISRNLRLNLFTTGYNYIVLILPTVIVAPLYLRGEIKLGDVTQSAVAFGHVLNALSVIVVNFGSLSTYAAVVRRLGAFDEAVDDAAKNHPALGSEIQIQNGRPFEFKQVTILTPNRARTLIEDFNLVLEGKRLLICGPSGRGKSAMVRAVAGLWSAGCGTIVRPPLEQIAFVPQRPYLIIGTLRSQILYGLSHKIHLDQEIISVLRTVELEEMLTRVKGLDAVVDWSATLSNGEQQRIGLARAILAASPFVFLDEATTAIDEKSEGHMYELIARFASTVVSVGYRSNLAKHHDLVLELLGDGKWRLDEVTESERRSS